MTGVDHLERFGGRPMFTLPLGDADGPLPEPESVAWRLDCDWEMSFDDLWERFARSVALDRVTALVIGPWWDERDDAYGSLAPVVDRLVEGMGALPALGSLFIADVVGEQCEVSWLRLADLTPLLAACPTLEKLGVRGGAGLRLDPVRHESLRELRFESGNLPGALVRGVVACDLPALEHLEFWFGASHYGGDAELSDVAPLLAQPERFPSLRHLGLQNGEFQDELAAVLAGAPLVAQLESLSLAMGTLSDTGAEALLSGQPLTHLRRLDLHHNFLSGPVRQRLIRDLESYGVDLDVPVYHHRGAGMRYVAVAE